ncbi:permease-like cell division protein FtsX [Tenggerimyces flavus]|uniref:Permease-like cell division protein FtsX n=1 Tax=Tenggerimyces flavus TaxID=1708749 RepID=A0ABV7YJG8_9ACTN|nr:permease-like cell division protein FtsX [Tenggerimyces flavus]MBM7787427.1 cell division protein FtsX [Tenggerimyces flavus]
MKLAILLGLVAGLLVGCTGPDSTVATCQNAVSAYLGADEDVPRVVERLRADDRFTDLHTETSARAAKRLATWYPAMAPVAQGRTAAAVHLAVTDPDRRQDRVEGLNAMLRGVGVARRADCDQKDEERGRQLVEFGEKLLCGQTVSIRFARDEDLRPALEVARNNARVQKVAVVSRAEAFERAKELFRDQPDLEKVLTPEDTSPYLEVTVVDSADPKAVGAQLTGILEGADQAQLQVCVTVPHPVVPARQGR